LDIFK